MRIRVSIGTAGVLHLTRVKQQTPPTTAYLMTYAPDGCIASCSFCPQSKISKSDPGLLSRISWPVFNF